MGKILVVDDDETVRELIKDLLTMNGHECATAVDGPEALDAIRQARYDLVILDRNMPKMDGIQVVETLRTNPAYKDLKIMICTSISLNKEVEDAFQAGANDYILKPINLQLMTNKVNKLLGA